VQEIISDIGFEAERVQMFNLSAAMAGEFVKAAEQMTEIISRLGPNPLYLKNEDEPAVNTAN
jgi:coenzyme F420-reducing hydrogenase delta subunit